MRGNSTPVVAQPVVEPGAAERARPVRPLAGRVVLVTGGTKGIGLATALAFGRYGAQCILTHRWGSADEEEIRQRFADVAAPPPTILTADAGHEADTEPMLRAIRADHPYVDTVVSGVAFAPVVHGLDEYSRRGLTRAIEYTAWPLVDLTRSIHAVFGRYPRYVIGLSSGGPDEFVTNYDVAAAAKAVLETLCRYLAYRLRDEDVRVNVIRARFVETDSLTATMGSAFAEFVQGYDPALFVSHDEVARAVLALASGMMDAVCGQVLLVDRGTTFSDNLMRMYDARGSRPVAARSESSHDQR